MKEKTVWQYLKEIIIWRFTKKKYIGKKFKYNGKRRTVIAETFTTVKFASLKLPVPKAYINCISFKK